MKKMLFVQVLVIVLLYSVLASAADKVVIIPLTGKKAIAEVARTGQAISHSAGDDGALQKGVIWPNPRFTDNTDGSVADNLTGLVWLKDANCFNTRLWTEAVNDSVTLQDGVCGLSDGSAAGVWRLPNLAELEKKLEKLATENAALKKENAAHETVRQSLVSKLAVKNETTTSEVAAHLTESLPDYDEEDLVDPDC